MSRLSALERHLRDQNAFLSMAQAEQANSLRALAAYYARAQASAHWGNPFSNAEPRNQIGLPAYNAQARTNAYQATPPAPEKPRGNMRQCRNCGFERETFLDGADLSPATCGACDR